MQLERTAPLQRIVSPSCALMTNAHVWQTLKPTVQMMSSVAVEVVEQMVHANVSILVAFAMLMTTAVLVGAGTESVPHWVGDRRATLLTTVVASGAFEANVNADLKALQAVPGATSAAAMSVIPVHAFAWKREIPVRAKSNVVAGYAEMASVGARNQAKTVEEMSIAVPKFVTKASAFATDWVPLVARRTRIVVKVPVNLTFVLILPWAILVKGMIIAPLTFAEMASANAGL